LTIAVTLLLSSLDRSLAQTGIVVILAAIALGCWWNERKRLSGTTLMAAWAWAGFALAALIVDCLATTSGGDSSTRLAAWHYLAAVTTFAPTMAVLGAKRPQHHAWQFIVATLLVVVALPGLTAMVFGESVTLHLAQVLFVVILVALGPANYLPTRFCRAGILFCLGQMLLLGAFLPPASKWFPEPRPLVALGCVAGAALWSVLVRPRIPASGRTIDRAWIRFRDAYGAAWALRVQDRFNQAARTHEWPLLLTWHGCVALPVDEETSSGVRQADVAERTLRMLLLRFVSVDWLEEA
jgi:hypothetical protein